MAEMHNPSTTNSQTQNLLGIYYDRVLLENLYPDLRMYELAEKKPIPKGIAKTITFTRLTKLGDVNGNLTEGVPPSPTWLSSSQITAELVQKGAYVPISDLLKMTALDPIVEDAAAELGRQAGSTIDRYIYNRLYGAAGRTGGDAENTFYGTRTYHLSAIQTLGTTDDAAVRAEFFSLNGTTLTPAAFHSFLTAAAPGVKTEYGLGVDVVRRSVYEMKKNNVPAFKDGSYVMVVAPEAALTLERDDEFKDWNSSQYAEKMFNGEIGKIAGCRIIQSTQVPVYAGSGFSVDSATGLSGVFNVLLGPKCIAVTEIDGHVHMHVKPAGSAGAVDPLDQVNTVGWKWTGVARVLDKDRGRIIISLV